MALTRGSCRDEAARAQEAAVRSLARGAREHRFTAMLGRTLLQPAVPITAGLKLARWSVAVAHDRERIAESLAMGLPAQFGGPVGALEPLGSKGPPARQRIATRPGLAASP